MAIDPVTGQVLPKILVVEDDADLLLMMKTMLKTVGEITLAKDGQEAYDMLKQGFKPDVIVTDVMMPRMDGITLAKTLKNDPHDRQHPAGDAHGQERAARHDHRHQRRRAPLHHEAVQGLGPDRQGEEGAHAPPAIAPSSRGSRGGRRFMAWLSPKGGGTMLKKILIAIGVVLAGFLAFAATRPDTYHVERTKQIDAPAEAVFPQLVDFKAWGQWSPWDKLDPQMQKTFDGPPGVVGSGYSWQGNDQVGKGKMTITEIEPLKHAAYKLEFIEPFQSVASTNIRLEPKGADATQVTWSMEGNNNFVSKVMSIFMDMDSMIGADFEKGLASLDTTSKDAAKKMAEARARAEAEAAAAQKAAAEAEAAAQPAKPTSAP